MTTSWTAEELRDRLIAACHHVVAEADVLTQFDAAAGDGDLGVTMARGFTAVSAALASDVSDTVGALLGRMGGVLAAEAPSTMGTLLGSALSTVAGGFESTHAVTAVGLADLLGAVAAEIAGLGGASVGQRTALDALRPAAEAAARAPNDVAVAIRAAAEAAERGAHETAAMTPGHGRARWTVERARGVPDGGATLIAIWLRGIASNPHEGEER